MKRREQSQNRGTEINWCCMVLHNEKMEKNKTRTNLETFSFKDLSQILTDFRFS